MWIPLKLQVVVFLYAENMEHDDTNISDMLPFGEYRIDIAIGIQLAARIGSWQIIVDMARPWSLVGHEVNIQVPGCPRGPQSWTGRRNQII